jgi:predicted PurR-regulated permease PerM
MTNGRPTRDVVFLLVGAAVLFITFWLAVRLRSLLVMLLIPLFLAFALEPAANLLARRGWRRGLATGAVSAGLILGVALFVAALGALLVDQVGGLVDAIPDYARQLTEFLNDTLGTELSGDKLAANLLGNPGVQDFVNGLAAAAVGLSTTLVGLILRGYIYSRALLAGCSALATTLFLVLVGVPYPLALGLWVGLVSQFVPSIGTYLAGALPVLIALLDRPVDALWVLAFIVAYQQLENMVLSPRITSRTMALHPAVAFGAVIAGGAIMGPVGALLALPAAASVQALVSS